MRKEELLALANDIAMEVLEKNVDSVQQDFRKVSESVSGKPAPEQVAAVTAQCLASSAKLSGVIAASLIDKLGLVQIDND